MATYVNDLRLKEIGTGESSGTWGTETNTNLELIAEAFSFGTEAITTNADTHTTTIADGSTDPGRSMYLKYTGTLDSACTITIGPNTVSKMWFIENGTSGSQNIIIKQGSGATITIPAGDVKVVYSDGAGSGAAVVDAFASLSVVDLKVQDDLTVTDDLIVNGDIDLEGSIDVNGTANLDVVDIDGAVDMASTLQVDGAITSSAGATITVADNSDNLTLTTTDADASAGPNLRMYRNSGSPADNDYIGEIQFEGRNDNSQDVVYAGLAARILDASDGTEDGRFELFTVRAGSQISTMMTSATELIFNNDSIDIDFRVESNGNANMLFVDGGNDKIGIGTSSPDGRLHVYQSDASITPDADADDFIIEGNGATGMTIGSSASSVGSIRFADSGSPRAGMIYYNHVGNEMRLYTNATERMRIDSSGKVGIGTTSPSEALHIEYNTVSGGDNYIHMRKTDQGAGQGVFIGMPTASNNLRIMNHANNAITFHTQTSDTERMRIDPSGNVGIGVQNCVSHLSIGNPSADGTIDYTKGITFVDTLSSPTNAWVHAAIVTTGSTGFNGNLIFATDGDGNQDNDTSGLSERMRITSAGNVGINNPSPDAQLHIRPVNDSGDAVVIIEADVNNDVETDNPMLYFKQDGAAVVGRICYTNNNVFEIINQYNSTFIIGRNNSTDISINTSGVVSGDFNDTSDINLKENISNIDGGLSVVNQLRAVNFDWKSDEKQNGKAGFIAQEVEEILPNEIAENDSGKSINSTAILAHAIKAIQEQQTIIDDLKSRIETLEG